MIAYLAVKEKYLIGILIFQEMQIAKCCETPLQKYSENIYPHFCVSEHFEHFLFFPYKKFPKQTRVLPCLLLECSVMTIIIFKLMKKKTYIFIFVC